MDETISAADANREFSRLLRGVREGNSYVVTSHGTPIARLVPIGDDSVAKDAAKKALIKRLRSQPVMNIGPWSRDELYDD